MAEYSTAQLLTRLWWDLRDQNERKYYWYSLIINFPGPFGNMLRGRFVSRRVRRAGSGLIVMQGTRFRSIENLSLGDNVSIGYDNFIQSRGGVTIGSHVMTAPGVKIWSTNHDFQDAGQLVLDQGSTEAPVHIGDDVWIASNAFILPGVTLPDGVVVSAGSVVGVKAYRPYSIIAGNPARVIGFRGRGVGGEGET